MSSNIAQIFESFSRMKALVVGDVMIDKYIFGDVSRISPEAPVPILDVYKRETRLGGAANVANNVIELGAAALLVSVVGDDVEGHALKQNLQYSGIDPSSIILDQERVTTIKTRVISRNQQMLRYDFEKIEPLDENIELLLIDNVIDLIYNEAPDVVILQDYDKGVLTPRVIANIIHNCRQAKIPVAVDPKFNNFLEYGGCTLLKPNLTEAIKGLNLDISPLRPETLATAHRKAQSLLQHEYTVITLADKGIFVGDDEDTDLIPAYKRKITDVSGAGDTVIALLGLGLALGLDVFATAELANIAAGMVCEQVGVVPINREALIREATMMMEMEEE